jgi:hypothetical protein
MGVDMDEQRGWRSDDAMGAGIERGSSTRLRPLCLRQRRLRS